MCIVNTEKRIETWIYMKSATNTNKGRNKKKTETVHSTPNGKQKEKKRLANCKYNIHNKRHLRAQKEEKKIDYLHVLQIDMHLIYCGVCSKITQYVKS